MYRSRLVPRIIPTIGLIGAPLLLVSCHRHPRSAPGSRCPDTALLLALPIAAWEFSLGVWLTVKGFKSTPSTDDLCPSATPDRVPSGAAA